LHSENWAEFRPALLPDLQTSPSRQNRPSLVDELLHHILCIEFVVVDFFALNSRPQMEGLHGVLILDGFSAVPEDTPNDFRFVR